MGKLRQIYLSFNTIWRFNFIKSKIMSNLHRLKHVEARNYYQEYTKDKPTYTTYINRIITYWYTKEDAIKLKLKRRQKFKINSNGRECSRCKQFKAWSLFHRDTKRPNGRSSWCIECRNSQKREARKNPQRKQYETKRKKIYNSSERWKQINKSYWIYRKHMEHNRNILRKIWELPKRPSIKKIKIDIIQRLGIEDQFPVLFDGLNPTAQTDSH